MSVADKIRNIYGIELFLDNYIIEVNHRKDKHINKIFIDYSHSQGTTEKYIKSNSKKYKGNYKPSYSNASIIQLEFDTFKTYINKKYNKK